MQPRRPARARWARFALTLSGVQVGAPAMACSLDPIGLGDLPQCERADAVATAGTCFEDSARELPVSLEPLHVLAANFVGDANVEAMAIGIGNGPIAAELWPGSDRGPVGPAIDPMVSGCTGYPVAGPLLGSGRDDLLFPSCSPSIDVYPGSELAFGPAVAIELPVLPRSTVVADLENDGDIDLVVLGEDTAGIATFSVVSRQADGLLATPTVQPVLGLTFDPFGIAAADFDADGFLDLALRREDTPGAIAYTRGTGTPTFAPPVQLATDLKVNTLAPADCDGDGDDDLVYADADTRTACVWIVDAVPEPAPRCWALDDRVPTHLAAGDLDDDGIAEVVFADATVPVVWVWDVNLAADVPMIQPLPTPAPADLVALVDFQGDGRLDLLAGHFAARTISIRLVAP